VSRARRSSTASRESEVALGKRVGRVTSACRSPRLEKNIGFAMVPIELADPGTELAIEMPDGSRAAVVVEMLFIDPKKEIPKQQLATGP
jgi:glycine cleavage system aminomethyltransferase T